MTSLVPAHSPNSAAKPAGRIRQKNEELILAAAEEEFARHGFKGTSMNTIALRAGLPKANLHYYFSNKLGLYIAVLSNHLELWDSAFNTLTAEDDPAEALARYIRAKMEFSRRHPLASKIFAMEIISGGSCLEAHFGQDYRAWFKGRAAVFEAWIAAGKMDPVDPVNLIFLLWSSTQHYADFNNQICRVTGRKRLTRDDFEAATQNLIQIILKGCGLTPPRDYLMPFTLSAPAEYREEIKKSRFIAHAAQVASVEEAQAFIARRSEPGASHNCWAWKLGNQYRFSDDGEPGGTAGRPILAAIEGQDCDQVAVLVIRYYGGIQLGTGGLARAYGGSAAKCLQGGERVELVARSRISCHPGFAELPLLKARLGEFEALVESEAFDAEGAELVLALPEVRIAGLEQLLRDISRGRLQIKRL